MSPLTALPVTVLTVCVTFQVLLAFGEASPAILGARLLGVYEKLKQAKLELFGGHSQFSIALKEGFTKAFQAMEDVQGIKVRSVGGDKYSTHSIPLFQ